MTTPQPRHGKVACSAPGRGRRRLAGARRDARNDVMLWARREEVAERSTRAREPDYLPGVELPAIGRRRTTRGGLTGADLVVLAAPSQTLRENLAGWAPYIRTTPSSCP